MLSLQQQEANNKAMQQQQMASQALDPALQEAGKGMGQAMTQQQ